jgi:MoaA/NifB/PqqE/SkfB family radical SAM enzyme
MSSFDYVNIKKVEYVPRIPLKGQINLTYRCNNNCRHRWVWIPPDSHEKKNELTFDEIKKIVDETRDMGCREWHISGGEPVFRPDFVEIFEHILSIYMREETRERMS